MSKKREIKVEGDMDVSKAVEYLERLAQGIKSGRVHLEKGVDVVELRPAQTLTVEVQAVQKKDKEKVVIELSWKSNTFASIATDGLIIDSEKS